jgi:hypothetical protein
VIKITSPSPKQKGNVCAHAVAASTTTSTPATPISQFIAPAGFTSQSFKLAQENFFYAEL